MRTFNITLINGWQVTITGNSYNGAMRDTFGLGTPMVIKHKEIKPGENHSEKDHE